LARARDEAEHASRAKSELLRNVSHEIRTPLTAMLGITELLARSPGLDADKRYELYERVLANGRSLLELMDDVLDLAKVEAGKLAIDRRVVGLSTLVADVVDSLDPEAA